MEHETRKNFNQFQQEPELHVQNRNQGPEIPQFNRSTAYQERQFQRHLQSELDKKRENDPTCHWYRACREGCFYVSQPRL